MNKNKIFNIVKEEVPSAVSIKEYDDRFIVKFDKIPEKITIDSLRNKLDRELSSDNMVSEIICRTLDMTIIIVPKV